MEAKAQEQAEWEYWLEEENQPTTCKLECSSSSNVVTRNVFCRAGNNMTARLLTQNVKLCRVPNRQV